MTPLGVVPSPSRQGPKDEEGFQGITSKAIIKKIPNHKQLYLINEIRVDERLHDHIILVPEKISFGFSNVMQ